VGTREPRDIVKINLSKRKNEKNEGEKDQKFQILVPSQKINVLFIPILNLFRLNCLVVVEMLNR